MTNILKNRSIYTDTGNQCGMSCFATRLCADSCLQRGKDRMTKRAVLIFGRNTAIPHTTSKTACR